jgi:hypothetical protein
MQSERHTVRRSLAALAVVCLALGYVEAALVVYLRQITAPVRREHFPNSVREVVPLLTLEQLRAAGESYPFLLAVEVAREPMPLLLLAACAWVLGRRPREALAYFLVGFGVWDILYYVFLKLLLNWPASPATWDVLYLIPTAWVAPVWAPLIVSATMIAAGMLLLFRRRPATRRRAGPAALLALAGAALILTSFLLRTAEAFQRVPRRYDWEWFLAGWLLSVAGVIWFVRPRRGAASRNGR